MHNKSCANHLLALRKCENGLKRSRAAYGEGTQGKSDGEPVGAHLRDGGSHTLLPRRAALHALRAAWGVLVEVRPILIPRCLPSIESLLLSQGYRALASTQVALHALSTHEATMSKTPNKTEVAKSIALTRRRLGETLQEPLQRHVALLMTALEGA